MFQQCREQAPSLFNHSTTVRRPGGTTHLPHLFVAALTIIRDGACMTHITATDSVELFRAAPHDYIPVSTGEVAYRRVGSGPDVLCIHGWPLSGATYRKVLPAMAEHVTCHVIDLPGSGSSRFDAETNFTLATHVDAVRSVVDHLDITSLGVVGQDSGGLLARHALAGDSRMRAFGLVDTEQPQGIGWRLRLLLLSAKLPGAGTVLGGLAGNHSLRRNGLAFGNVFADRDLLDGEFDEFFLQPLATNPEVRKASTTFARNFDLGYVTGLSELHEKITEPTVIVFGSEDAYFPRRWNEEMVSQFANARLEVVDGAGLLSHEERPGPVADALLSVLA